MKMTNTIVSNLRGLYPWADNYDAVKLFAAWLKARECEEGATDEAVRFYLENPESS